MEHGPTTWLLQLPLLPHDERFLPVNGAIVVFLGILGFSLIVNRAIRKGGDAMLVPSKKLNLSTVADLLVEGLYGLVESVLGHHGREHFSFIAAIFLFVWFSNLLGILPLSASPSGNVNTTFALGIISFIYYNVMGIRSHGAVGYAKHFLMGMKGLLVLVGLLVAAAELLSHLVRPLTLGLRLFVNLHVDHELVGAFAALSPWLLPVPLLLFGVVVCTIQAFLFAILNTVYVQMATEHEEH